jgi:dienelactone hydrolase
MSALPDYEEQQFDHRGFSFPIFRKGNGPGVILLHELPGLTQETVEFADFIAANGFHVVMPLLFGSPLQNPTIGNLKSPLLCIRREFNCFADGKSSPITTALRGLCAKIHDERGGKGIGAIGMCFTGGFVLTMMLEPSLLAPITAQPSLPFFPRCALDVETETLNQITNRSDDAVLLGLRFKHDHISPEKRMDRLRQVFSGTTPLGSLRLKYIEVPGKGHSTLTFDYFDAKSRGMDTRQTVLEHLRKQLLL